MPKDIVARSRRHRGLIALRVSDRVEPNILDTLLQSVGPVMPSPPSPTIGPIIKSNYGSSSLHYVTIPLLDSLLGRLCTSNADYPSRHDIR